MGEQETTQAAMHVTKQLTEMATEMAFELHKLKADHAQLVALVQAWADAKIVFDEKRLDEDFEWRERHRNLEAAERALLTYRKELGAPPVAGKGEST